MNIPFLNEINETSNMDPSLITRFYQLKLMNDFMNVKYQNPKLKQSEIASQLKVSTSSIQRQRNDINMNSPYRINQNNVKKRQKRSKLMKMIIIKGDLLTSIDLNSPQMIKNKIKKCFKSRICTRRKY